MNRAPRCPQHTSTLGLALALCNSVDVQWRVNVIPQPSGKVWEDPSASIQMSTTANACSEDFGGQPFAKWFVPWCMIELPRLAKQSWHWLVDCRARVCASAVALLSQKNSCCFFKMDCGKSLCLCFFLLLRIANHSDDHFKATANATTTLQYACQVRRPL